MLQNAFGQWWTERVTKAIRSITTDHSYIHEGIMFYASHKASIASGATLKFTFTTPDEASGIYVHFRPSFISCSGDKLTMTMTEVPTLISGGTAITAYNRNRICSILPTVTIKQGVTLTESAIVVDTTYLGGGTGVGQDRSGSETGEVNEIVMKQNTVYSITLLNESAAANVAFIKMLWYEESGA